VEKGLKSIEKNLARLVEKGTLTEAAKNEARGRLKGTTSLEDLKDCDLIVEAIIEQLPGEAGNFLGRWTNFALRRQFCEQLRLR